MTVTAVLVADVGGTHTRMARFDGVLRQVETWETKATPNLAAAIARYRALHPEAVCAAGVAVAGPVGSDRVALTNVDWTGSVEDFDGPICFVNDLEAAATGLSCLGPDDVTALFGPEADPDAPAVVLGLGTGLGEAYRIGGQIIPGEGGHRAFAPDDDLQRRYARDLRRIEGRETTWEHVLSGDGLGRALDFMHRRGPAPGPSRDDVGLPELARRATGNLGVDPSANAALDLYVRICVAEARGQALQVLAYGGVWLLGGMPLRIPVAIWRAGFQQAFVDDGAHKALLEKIPVRLVLHPHPQLLGAAVRARALLQA